MYSKRMSKNGKAVLETGAVPGISAGRISDSGTLRRAGASRPGPRRALHAQRAGGRRPEADRAPPAHRLPALCRDHAPALVARRFTPGITRTGRGPAPEVDSGSRLNR